MKKALAVAASMVAILMIAAGLLVRDEVAAVRALAAHAVAPLPRNVRAAIIAAVDPILVSRPRLSVRGLAAIVAGRKGCGPSPIAFTLVKSVTRPRRSLRWHLETGL